MRVAIAIILIFVALVGGVTCLQVYLSTRKRFWFGLILPVLGIAFFLLSLFLAMPIFNSVIDMAPYSQSLGQPIDRTYVKSTVYTTMAVLYNLPTVGLFITLAICRYCMYATRKQVIAELNAQIVPPTQYSQTNDHSN